MCCLESVKLWESILFYFIYRIKQVNTCEPSLCRYLYRILPIWCEIKTCQAADQINKPIIVMSAGFFSLPDSSFSKNKQLLKYNQRRKKKKLSKALLLQSFIPLLWLETASKFLNKANSINAAEFLSGSRHWNINSAANSNTLVEELIDLRASIVQQHKTFDVQGCSVGLQREIWAFCLK